MRFSNSSNMRFLFIASVAVLIFQTVLTIEVERLDGNYKGAKYDPIVVRVSLNSKQLRNIDVKRSHHNSVPRELLGNSKSAASLTRVLKDLMENYRRMQISGKMEYVKEEEAPQTSDVPGPESGEKKKHILRTASDGNFLRVENHLKAQMPNANTLTNFINVLANDGAEKGFDKLMGLAKKTGTRSTGNNGLKRTDDYMPSHKYTKEEYKEIYRNIKSNPKIFARYKKFRYLAQVAGVQHKPIDLFIEAMGYLNSMETDTDYGSYTETETETEEWSDYESDPSDYY